MYKKVRKTFCWLGALPTPPLKFFVRQRAKNYPNMTDISKDQDTHIISVCIKSESSIWFLRPWMQKNGFDLFLAVKFVKVSDWNETRTWRVTPPTACIYQISNWYIKTCRNKARNTLKNPKRAKIIAKIPNIIFSPKKRNLCEEV